MGVDINNVSIILYKYSKFLFILIIKMPTMNVEHAVHLLVSLVEVGACPSLTQKTKNDFYH